MKNVHDEALDILSCAAEKVADLLVDLRRMEIQMDRARIAAVKLLKSDGGDEARQRFAEALGIHDPENFPEWYSDAS